jgi:hypothetical protein
MIWLSTDDKAALRALLKLDRETEEERQARLKAEKKALRELHIKNFEFDKLRTLPTEKEIAQSIDEWDYGIYYIWSILNSTTPGVGYIPEEETARRGKIEVIECSCL